MVKCPCCNGQCELISELHDRNRDVQDALLNAGDAADTVRKFDETVVVPLNKAFPQNTESENETDCVCGLPLVLYSDNLEYPGWTHKYPAPKCRTAVPAAGLQTRQDRADLIVALAENADNLDKAKASMTDLKHRLDGIDAAMARAEATLNSPNVIRRATLSQVLDRLLDKGDMAGYLIVSGMLRDGS